MTASTVLTIILAFFAVLSLFGALLGLFRGAGRAAVRIACIVAAAALAIPLSATVTGLLSAERIGGMLTSLAEKIPESAEMIENARLLLDELAVLLPTMQGILRPFAFIAVFCLLAALLWCVVLIVSFFLPKKKGDKAKQGKGWLCRLGGGAIGLLQGALVAALLLTPFVGYLSLTNEITTAYASEGGDELTVITELQTEMITPLCESPVISLTERATAPLFARLFAVKSEGDTISLRDEVPILLCAADRLTSLSGVPIAEYGNAEREALNALPTLFSDSALLPSLTAELLSSAAIAWQAGDAYMGIEAPDTGEELAPLSDAMIAVLATLTTDTVERDFKTTIDFILLAIDYDILTEIAEGGDVFAKASEIHPESGITFIKAAVTLLDQNPHMRPLRTGITSFGANLLASKLGTPEEIRENYGDMVTAAVDVLKTVEGETSEEQIASLTPVLRDELAAEGIELTDDVVDEASRFLLDELDSKGITLSELTEDEVYDILDRLATGVQ